MQSLKIINYELHTIAESELCRDARTEIYIALECIDRAMRIQSQSKNPQGVVDLASISPADIETSLVHDKGILEVFLFNGQVFKLPPEAAVTFLGAMG